MNKVIRSLSLVGILATGFQFNNLVRGDDLVENVTHELGGAEWIWSPAHKRNEVPLGDCYFRKTFELADPEVGELQITADNQFEVFVNGQRVGTGNDWRQLKVFNVTTHLVRGTNSVAVRVSNSDPGSAGLVGRILVKEKSGTYANHPTDDSWKTSVRNYSQWSSTLFPDSEWVAAKSYGLLGIALPWGNEIVVAGVGARFKIAEGFAIERLMRDEEVGSLIAMAFDSRGNILASREGGNLLFITDSDDNGNPDSVSVFSEKLVNVQGILPMGTRVFAIGDGPAGVALYRLRDADHDGVAEEVTPLVPIRGSRGEHGAHAVRLGPDGMIYVIVGDHARVGSQPRAQSPYAHPYEGDLVQPRYDDPRGHAVGIPAPGGTIFRTDAEGTFVELVAGGIRNSYDFAFNRRGELFTYDSDMEWDMGAPWYRPTRVNHITAGAELGWRSGWAKWPEYYLDSLPAAVQLGAGSPTGVEFYEHQKFPAKYQGAMFGCDWATGHIYCIRLDPAGATYRGKTEAFIAGKPLNATDIAVGDEGALYFCTGGRGTDGGIYRVRWTGELPATNDDSLSGIDQALRQPQLDADWARAKIATVKADLAESWAATVTAVAQDPHRDLADRLRALDLMVFFGPAPTDLLLLELSQDSSGEVRSQAARLMFASGSSSIHERLEALLTDAEPVVRRLACESLLRQGMPITAELLVNLLADKDRFVAFAARRALEKQPPQSWAQLVLDHSDLNVFCRGAVPLLACSRDPGAALAILNRCQSVLHEPAAAKNSQRLDLLRVVQLALELGKVPAAELPELGNILLANYPSGDPQSDRELVRLLVHLQVPGSAERFASQLALGLPYAEKLHLAAYAALLQQGWTIDSKLAFMRFFEEARTVQAGYSVSAYVENFARDFFTNFSLAERQQVLASGERWPAASLSVLAKLPPQPPAELLGVLRTLDGRVQPLCSQGDAFRRLRVGIMAVLGRSGEAESLVYLRALYTNSPADRATVAMSLSQQPGGDNWPYLLDALKIVEGRPAQEILSALAKVPQKPQEAAHFRQVILQGLRAGEQGAPAALALLDHWAGRAPVAEYPAWQSQLAQWQQWYSQTYPNTPRAELPVDSPEDKWSYEELLTYLESAGAQSADPEQGRLAFGEAQCVKCHRYESFGETLGPDLTTVARRFQRREILESIVFPSHIISDQYASQIVIANGKTHQGLVVPRGEAGVTVLTADGEKIEIARAEIGEIKPSTTSAMPAGLLNRLTLEQVGQLFAFLEGQQLSDLAQQPERQVK